MKTIKFESNYGQFAYSMSIALSEDVGEPAASLCREGLANIAYRVCGSAADKAMGVTGEKGAKLCKRADVEYSDDKAITLNVAVLEKLKELAAITAFYSEVVFEVTGKYVPKGNGDVPTKEATELWAKVQQYPEERFQKVLGQLGLGDDYTDESGVLACKRYLAEAKRKAAEASKNSLGV